MALGGGSVSEAWAEGQNRAGSIVGREAALGGAGVGVEAFGGGEGGDVGDGIIEGAIDFFVNVLGFALDPKSAVNMKEGSGKYDRYQ